jgi:hyperosmotically inducible protein
MFRRLAAACAIALMPLAAAAGQPERRDVQIFNDVARQVSLYSRFTVFDDINAAVNHGVVTLTGKVTMPFKRDDIVRRVAAVDGVKAVQDRLEVLPASRYDDQLRYQIARAIYTNPAFWTYAIMASPPIHIVVDGGRVTLTGVVNNEVDRMLARSLATGCGAFSVVNELKTDAEAKAALEKME